MKQSSTNDLMIFFLFLAVMCPILPDPDNATIFVSGRSVGSQATYICNSGFVVREGDVIIRNCLSSGQWSETEPQCIRKYNNMFEYSSLC